MNIRMVQFNQEYDNEMWFVFEGNTKLGWVSREHCGYSFRTAAMVFRDETSPSFRTKETAAVKMVEYVMSPDYWTRTWTDEPAGAPRSR